MFAVARVWCDEHSDPVDFIEFNCNRDSVTLEFCKPYMAAVEFYGLNSRENWSCVGPCAALLKKLSGS